MLSLKYNINTKERGFVMKKLLISLVLVLSLFGCLKPAEEEKTFNKTFECKGAGFTMQFKKDGTVILTSAIGQKATGTYTKDGKTAFRITFDGNGIGGYVKIDGNQGGLIADEEITAEEVDAMEMSAVDEACSLK